MKYFLVRAKWDGVDMSSDFIKNNEWINGYGQTKYTGTIEKVEINDTVIMAGDNREIKNIGRVYKTSPDGETLPIIWFNNFSTFAVEHGGISAIRSTISQIYNWEIISIILRQACEKNDGLKDFLNINLTEERQFHD